MTRFEWLRRQQDVLLAMTLQDMKTRFGASYTSYLLAIAWPITHVAVITVGYLIANHYAPVGDDPFVFVATAAIPYMLCLYPTRLIASSIVFNKPFLNYNIVSVYHLIIARTALEFLNATIAVLLVFFVCYAMGIDLMPLSIPQAALAVAAAVSFGMSLGFFFSILTAIFGPFFNVFIVIFMLALYISAFAFVPEHLLNSRFRDFLEYNPIFCLVYWLRSAYYPSYQLGTINREYVVWLTISLTFLSLLGERFLRGRIIS